MRRQPIDKHRGPFVKGIDVSRYQAKVDYVDVKQDDYEFVFVRSGDGKDVDKLFKSHWDKAGEAGLRRGIYRYLRADRDGFRQAQLDLKMLDAVGGFGPWDLTFAGDIEHGISKDLRGGEFDADDLDPNGEIETVLWLKEALEYMETLEAGLEERGQSRRLLIYTGMYWHWRVSQLVQHDADIARLAKQFARFGLWVPSYGRFFPALPVDIQGNAAPWGEYDFHQITGHGAIDGIPGDVDINRFRGSMKDMDALWPPQTSC